MGARLKSETEGLTRAAQDQSLTTRNYEANIIKMDPTQYIDCANKKKLNNQLTT